MSKTTVCVTIPFKKPKPNSDLVVFNDIRPFIPEWDSVAYIKGCSRYAMQYKVYLVPARVVIDNTLYLCLIDPNGEILGVQGASHVSLAYHEKFIPDNRVNIISTQIGKIFLCVDVDIYQPAILRNAALQGANIVVSSQYVDSYQFTRELISTGIWNSAQQNPFYVVGCCNFFKAVAAPMATTQDSSGYIAQPSNESTLVANLYLHKLQKDINLPNPLQNKAFALEFAKTMLTE
ncbi:MAG: hypothetical protein RR263_01980 [Oscillospiraceae bacterium]